MPPKSSRSSKSQEKYNFYLTIILVLLAFFGTRLHEFLHQIVAFLFGWSSSVTTTLLTGSTSVEVLSSTPPSLLQLWIFYLFPSTFLFISILLLTITHPNRFIQAMGIVIIGLNISSFSIEIPSSDASLSLQSLINSGAVSPFIATLLHWVIFALALLIYILYIYIVNDNNSNDVKKRLTQFF
jgi:hypothetical protein